jgi:hypothetical protein
MYISDIKQKTYCTLVLFWNKTITYTTLKNDPAANSNFLWLHCCFWSKKKQSTIRSILVSIFNSQIGGKYTPSAVFLFTEDIWLLRFLIKSVSLHQTKQNHGTYITNNESPGRLSTKNPGVHGDWPVNSLKNSFKRAPPRHQPILS